MELFDLLNATTAEHRKGDVVEREMVGAVEVTHVYAMPHRDDAPQGWPLIDCEFVEIAVDPEAAEAHRDDLLEWLRAYPQPERLAGGPSYLEVGGVVGDQGYAFRLFALGEVLGLWRVLTPRRLVPGLSKKEARELAGRGLVMITGWKEQR